MKNYKKCYFIFSTKMDNVQALGNEDKKNLNVKIIDFEKVEKSGRGEGVEKNSFCCCNLFLIKFG